METPRGISLHGLLDLWHRFVSSQADLIKDRPRIITQQAANQPSDSPVTLTAERHLRSSGAQTPWLRWLNKPRQTGACLVVVTGHGGSVQSCTFSPDGMLLAIGGIDGCLRICRTTTGECVEKLTIVDGGRINHCDWSANGRVIVALSDYGTLQFYDARSCQTCAALPGRRPAAVSPDGSQVVTNSDDGTLRVWGVEGALRRTLPRIPVLDGRS
jgi:WD40 repeat protein